MRPKKRQALKEHPPAPARAPARQPAPSRAGPLAASSRLRTLIIVAALAVIAGSAWMIMTFSAGTEREDALRAAGLGRFPDVEPALARLAAKNPEDVEIIRELARGYLGLRQPHRAEEYVLRWRALQPDDIAARRAVISLREMQRRWADAVPEAQFVLTRQPADDALRQSLAIWLFFSGDFDEAARQCEIALQKAARDQRLRYLAASIEHRRGRGEQAARILDELIKDAPQFGNALALRGEIHLAAGQLDDAVRLLRLAQQNNPSNETAVLHFLSQALYQLGRKEEADKVLAAVQEKQASQLYDQYGRMDSLGMLLRRGESLLDVGKVDEALDLLRRAIGQDPNCSQAHRLLAECYERKGEKDKAAEHRRKGLP